MSKISAFRTDPCTFIPDHPDVDGYLYKYVFDSKLQTRIDNQDLFVAGNRIFHSFMSGSDGTALRLSFDGTNYLDTYIMYGGLYVDQLDETIYKSDGALILYCADPNDHTISTAMKINLSDNTNACMSPDSFIQPTTFLGASTYVTLDDDHTSAIMVSVGGLTPIVGIQDSEWKYEYTETQKSLKQQDSVYSTWKDMTLYDIKGANTGQVVHGYGGRSHTGIVQYGWKLNLRKGTSSKQHEYSWNSIGGFYFGYHLGGLWYYGDDHWGSAYYGQKLYRMPVYFDSSPYGTSSLWWSVYNGILFGHANKMYLYGGGAEYSDPGSIAAYNISTNTWSTIYDNDTAGGPSTRNEFAGVKHPTKPFMYFFGGVDDGDGVLDSAQMYDITQNTMINLSPMPVPLHHHSASIVNDRIYIIGGMLSRDGVEPEEMVYNTNIYEYNISLDSWRTVKTDVRPRYRHTAAEYDGTIYLIGGLFGSDDDFHIYHEIDMFVARTSSDMPGWKYLDFPDRDVTLSQFVSVAEQNGVFYFYGGLDADGTSMVEFNPDTNLWLKLADNTISSATNIGMTVLDGTIFITGGWDSTFSNRLICYIIAEDRWQEGPPMPVGHQDPAMLVHDGTVQVKVGYTGSYTNQLYAFDPVLNEWHTKANGSVNRSKVCFAADGTKLFVFGGHDGFHIGGYFHPMTTIEVYDTQTNTQSVHSTTYADTGTFVERSKAMMHTPFMRNGNIQLFGGQDNAGEPVMTTDIFNPVTGLFEVGDGVFGGGEPMYDQYADYNETIGAFPVGDTLYVFYAGDSTIVGVYTFPEAVTDQAANVIPYEEVGFFDAVPFTFAENSFFLDISTSTFNEIFAVNPYPKRFGHASVKMGSDILSIGGMLRRTSALIDQMKIPPVMITEVVLKDLTNAVDMIEYIDNDLWGREAALTDKTSDWDFGQDTTAGVDGWYAYIDILPTDDVTNIVFEVMGGSITRVVLHLPNENPNDPPVFDEEGLMFPVEIDLVGISSPGPICAYLRVPEGTVIKHIWCSI